MNLSTLEVRQRALFSHSKVLIIESDDVSRMMLRQVFLNVGVINVIEAKDGEEGLLETLRQKPDLVLLDLNMPVMNGVEYCKRIRSNPVFKNLPILVQTGLADLKSKEKLFDVGATDYVNKPLDFKEVTIRSLIHLERAAYIKQLEEFNERVRRQLFAARQLLELSIPNEQDIERIKKDYQIELASEFKSSNEMGGDFWSFVPLDKDRFALYCFDLSGHGLDSALNAMRLHSILYTNLKWFSTPGKLLNWLNKILLELLPSGQFSTMFYGVVDIAKNKMDYAVSAMPSAMIIRSGSKDIELIKGDGFPLGAWVGAKYETRSVSFNPGDTLVVCTDGLTEAEDEKEKLLGEEGMVELLDSFKQVVPFNAKDGLRKLLQIFYGRFGNDLNDDLTINVYHRLPSV